MGYNRSYYDNMEKIENLESYRENSINGMSSKQLKTLLNKLGKNDDYIRLLKLILDIEDNNISAKKYSFSRQYKDMYYDKKEEGLKSLISELSKNKHIKEYGKGNDSDCHITSNVFFLQFPHINQQISWHTKLVLNVKPFKYKYDKSERTTISRILEEIETYFDNNEISLNYEDHFKPKIKKTNTISV